MAKKIPPPTAPLPMTDNQLRVYQALYDFTRKHGFQPNYRELMEQLDIRSTNGVRIHLLAVERKGWLKLKPREFRAIRFIFTPSGKPFRGFVEPE